jgi:hypothetical protein
LERNVNPVRNSSGTFNPAVIILKCNSPQRSGGIISNGVKCKKEVRWPCRKTFMNDMDLIPRKKRKNEFDLKRDDF